MIRELYFNSKIELRDIAKKLEIPISKVYRIQANIIAMGQAEKKTFNYVKVPVLGTKKDEYYSESELLEGLPSYNLEDLQGDELEILKKI